MLQTIRSKTAGIVAKALFILLLLSFAVWGIGDYSFLRQTNDVAIEVGNVEIRADRLSQEYQREVERLRRTFGQFDPELARQFGLMDQVVDRLITETVFDLETDRLGLVISDDVIRTQIANNQSFHGPTGQFDPQVFQQVLFANGLNEVTYTQMLRRDLARTALIESLAMGGRAPDILVDRMYRHREERRIGETVLVPASAMEDVGEPDEAALKSVYDDNTERFTQPEYRKLSVLRLSAEDLVKTVRASEEQIREEYEVRLPELRVPERRDVEQMVFQDEGAANAAAAKVAAGTPFVDVAREAANQTPEQTTITGVVRDDLVPPLADVVFSAAQGAVVGPVKSPLGWHLFRIVAVHAGKEPTLEEVREKIEAEVAQRLAANAAYDASVTVEEALAAGETVEEAAGKVGVEILRIAAVDARGLDPDGKPVTTLIGAPEVLQAAFQTEPTQTSQLIETRNGAYFIVRVDEVTASRVKPFEEVHAELIELWKQERRNEAARKRAEEIAARVNQGETLEAAAAAFKLKPQTTAPVRRDGRADQGNVPSEVTAQLFVLKAGEAGVAPAADGFHVVRLANIKPADPAADADGVARLKAQLGAQIGNDLVQELGAALRARYGVTIHRDVIDRLL